MKSDLNYKLRGMALMQPLTDGTIKSIIELDKGFDIVPSIPPFTRPHANTPSSTPCDYFKYSLCIPLIGEMDKYFSKDQMNIHPSSFSRFQRFWLIGQMTATSLKQVSSTRESQFRQMLLM